jgi:hypothetical protein
MSRSRIVVPSVVRLPLSDGDTLDVKKELNAGEYFDYLTAMAERQPFAKILAYAIGWSFVALDGTLLPYSVDLPETERRDLVRSLDTDTMHELLAVIDRHEAALDAARLAKKKAPSGGPESSAPSTSPVAAAGATNGSMPLTETSTT